MGVCLYLFIFTQHERSGKLCGLLWVRIELCVNPLRWLSLLCISCVSSGDRLRQNEPAVRRLYKNTGRWQRVCKLWLMLFCSDWLMQWVACVAEAAWDDVGGYISQLCLESGTQRKNMHTHEPPVHRHHFTHTHVRSFSTQRLGGCIWKCTTTTPLAPPEFLTYMGIPLWIRLITVRAPCWLKQRPTQSQMAQVIRLCLLESC